MEAPRAAPDTALGTELPFRPPKQRRSRETLNRIALAALEVIEKRGLEGATIAAIVERSGVSVGSFYARFPRKGNLVQYLRGRVWEEARERWDVSLAEAVWDGLSMGEVVEGVVGLLFRSYRDDHLRRQAFGEERHLDSEGAALANDLHEHVLSTLRPLLLSRRNEIFHPAPEKAVEFGYRFVVGAIKELMEPRDRGEVPGAEEMIREISKAWVGYLGGGQRAEAAEAEGAVDFFDPWG